MSAAQAGRSSSAKGWRGAPGRGGPPVPDGKAEHNDWLGLVDTILGIGLPYMASAFVIFLMRRTFKTVPRELEDAARVEGCSSA